MEWIGTGWGVSRGGVDRYGVGMGVSRVEWIGTWWGVSRVEWIGTWWGVSRGGVDRYVVGGKQGWSG